MELYKETGVSFRRECWKKTLVLVYENGAFVYKNNGNTEGRPSNSMLKMGDFIKIDNIGATKMAQLSIGKNNNTKRDLDYIGKDFAMVTLQDRITCYKVSLGLKLEKGDLVVVELSHGLEICKVDTLYTELTYDPTEHTYGKSWVVDKINLEDYTTRRANTEKKSALLRELHKRRKETDELDIFEAMAEKDSLAKRLLDELKRLV